MTYSTLQMERRCVSGEGHGGEQVRLFFTVIHLGQQAVTVDPDLGFLQGRQNCLLHRRVAEGRDAGLGGCEEQMDTMSLDPETEQRLHGGEDIQAASIDDGIICTDTRRKHEA